MFLKIVLFRVRAHRMESSFSLTLCIFMQKNKGKISIKSKKKALEKQQKIISFIFVLFLSTFCALFRLVQPLNYQ